MRKGTIYAPQVHPVAIETKKSSSHVEKQSVSKSVQESSTASVVTTCATRSDRVSLTASSSVNTSDVLNDILKLPQHSIKKTSRKE